jgi:predicted dinucleotide-binding enzyme
MGTKNILVIGAAGALGSTICKELLRLEPGRVKVFLGDYKPDRGKELAANLGVEFRLTNVREPDTISQAVKGMDLVIVSVPQASPICQAACLEQGVHCVDVVVSKDFCDSVEQVFQDSSENSSAAVLMAGFFPGLSGILARELHSGFDEAQAIDVALIQSSNARAGADGIGEMLEIISAPVVTTAGNRKPRRMAGFQHSSVFQGFSNEPAWTARLIDHSEARMLRNRWNVEWNYWTCWDSRAMNLLLSFLARIRLLPIIAGWLKRGRLRLPDLHNPEKDEMTRLIGRGRGILSGNYLERRIALRVFSDYGMTARMAVALTLRCLKESWVGVVYPFEKVNLTQILSQMRSDGIEMQEQSG